MAYRIACALPVFLVLAWNGAQAAPHISRAVSVPGAIAYQDDSDNSQFWWIPTVAPIDTIGSGPLKAFSVTYSGIGQPYYACTGSLCRPSYGANLGATINIDLTPKAAKDLRNEITRRFGVANPKMAPVRLTNVKVNSLLVDTLSVAKISQKFSNAFQFKTDVGFTAGSNGSNFGANLATTTVGVTGVVPNPAFSVEFQGETEFAGDPWIVEATCDFSQAWSYVRSSVSVSASLGWFRLGQGQYESLAQDLQRLGICTYSEKQGTLDVRNDLLPVLQMIKKIFEEMNAQAGAGEGFFKFEPNPDPPEVSAKGATSSWPWRVSVNVGRSEASFKQNFKRTVRTEIQPRFNAIVGTTVVVAAKCTPQTKQYFTDLGDPSQPCITPAKAQMFQQTASAISQKLDQRLADLAAKLESGAITESVYNKLRADAIEDAGGSLKITTDRQTGETHLMQVRTLIEK